jgi:hypothetical protein
MSTETIFFSYSRDDTEFVLQLAKNLRQAGANIWLDQLDISPGSRWDKSIQDALTNSKVLLVILSKTSVASDNVLDEVSFALEEGKRVVPVLLENCEIPFRLRRLQYADFTEHHKKGIETLVQALNLNTQVASKLSDAAEQKTVTAPQNEIEVAKKLKEEIESGQNLKPTQENVIPSSETKKQVEEKTYSSNPSSKPGVTANPVENPSKKSKGKKVMYGLLVLAILATAAWSAQFFIEDEDTKFFNDSLSGNTLQDFEMYITRFPEGKFVDQARDSMYAKISRNKIKQEKEAWDDALKSDNLDGYHAYLTKFPNGNYVQEAEEKIKVHSNNLDNIRLDEDAWKSATIQASVTAFLEYFTNQAIVGSHREEALQKINEIGNKGWLYCGRFSGDFMTESIFDLKWRGEDFSPKDILKTHDVVMLKPNESARKTYRYATNRNTNNANNELIGKNTKMYVLAVEKEGNALIVQIIY